MNQFVYSYVICYSRFFHKTLISQSKRRPGQPPSLPALRPPLSRPRPQTSNCSEVHQFLLYLLQSYAKQLGTYMAMFSKFHKLFAYLPLGTDMANSVYIFSLVDFSLPRLRPTRPDKSINLPSFKINWAKSYTRTSRCFIEIRCLFTFRKLKSAWNSSFHSRFVWESKIEEIDIDDFVHKACLFLGWACSVEERFIYMVVYFLILLKTYFKEAYYYSYRVLLHEFYFITIYKNQVLAFITSEGTLFSDVSLSSV